jgi:hypothetical protein
MSDKDLNALLDELQAANDRAALWEKRHGQLVDKAEWLAMGANALAGAAPLPSLPGDEEPDWDAWPCSEREAALITGMLLARVGLLGIYEVLREGAGASAIIKDQAKGVTGSMSLDNPRLMENAMEDLAKMTFVLRRKGLFG